MNKFLSQLFWSLAKVNFKIYDVTNWIANIYNKHISDISKSKDKQPVKVGQLLEYTVRNTFFQKPCGK